jgi:hypothetical protein
LIDGRETERSDLGYKENIFRKLSMKLELSDKEFDCRKRIKV